MTDQSADASIDARPDAVPGAPDVAAIEALLRRAIDERRPDLLPVVGKGEMSIAVRWTADGEPCVVKRVPPFPSRASAEQYVELVREHIAALEAAGVRCVSTGLHLLDRPDGSVIAYHCQPLLQADHLADRILMQSEPAADHPVLNAVMDANLRALRAGQPLDAQVANWYVFEGEAWHLDFSTPLLIDAEGDIRFDSTGFQREYPAALRRTVYKEMMKIAGHLTDPAWMLTDVMTQLIRQGLDAWCPPLAEAARDRHGIEIDPAVARKRFEADAKFYPNLLRLKRFQRAWMQRTGRRYDGLLPETTTFGK